MTEYNTCIWSVWHEQNPEGVGDCNNVERLYPICNQTNDENCVGQTLKAESVYCKGWSSCQNSHIILQKLLHQK